MTTKIYTDGSCLSNPGAGGWAFFVVGHGCYSHGKAYTTNNEMELTAIVKAVCWCRENEVTNVTIYTDSAYCMNGATQWLDNWIRNGWKSSTGSKVKNLELWKEYVKQSYYVKVKFVKVKAHSGDVGNEFVDKKSREAAEKFQKIS